jgi:glycosyltransferase involved in cell wall biosynthesis
MAEITTTKPLTVELVAKAHHASSGPRGVDVYAKRLYEELVRQFPQDTYLLGEVGAPLRHYTFFDPFFLTLPRGKKGMSQVVTVHDLIPLKFPDHLPRGIRGELKWQLQKRRLKKVEAIITDSECSARDIHEIIGYPKENIHVIPLSAPHTTVTARLARGIQAEYQLPSRYILYVGDINWNKNVVGLIAAFAQIKDPSVHLVLVGKAFVSSEGTVEGKAIKQAIEDSDRASRIHTLGFIPSHHLPSLYRQATLYVQPSWYEGFGFPLLEAMVQGCPVLSSNQGSLPEVGGSCVHYFDPSKKGELANMLQSLLGNAALREKYVDEAKLWVKGFNWSHVAGRTREVYAHILS